MAGMGRRSPAGHRSADEAMIVLRLSVKVSNPNLRVSTDRRVLAFPEALPSWRAVSAMEETRR